MNEKNRIWWIGGIGALVVAALSVLLFEGPSMPGKESKPAADSARAVAEDQGLRNDQSSDGFGAIETPARRPAKNSQLPVSRDPNPTTEQCLEALASGTVEADRVRAAMLLGQRANEEGLAEKAVPALITAMENDEKSQVWLVSAQALGKYGADAAEAVPSLMHWFDHVTMRNVAIEALGGIGADAEPAIESISLVAVDDQEGFVSRRKAIEALVKIGGPEHPFVAPVLEAVAADPEKRIRIAIQQALKSQAGEGATANGNAQAEPFGR
ncbi:MAG: HEAT repeat protein [Verrucomicrobiales bacterium]|jgi:HEAT repeat protein